MMVAEPNKIGRAFLAPYLVEHENGWRCASIPAGSIAYVDPALLFPDDAA